MKRISRSVVSGLMLALVASLAAAAAQQPQAVTVAKARAPAGGVYVLKIQTQETGRTCYRLDRRRRDERYVINGCRRTAPLAGAAAYNCVTSELGVVGVADRTAERVLIVMSDGRRVPARVHEVPERAGVDVRMFARALRIGADGVDDMHPASIRAYDATGTVIAEQRFPLGSARGFGCF